VLSTTLKRDDCAVFDSLETLLKEIKKYPKDEVYLIGGAKLYKTLLPFCEEVLVTKVDADGDAQVFFENLDALDGWHLISESQPLNSNGYDFKFTTYKNDKVKEI
jgi:dihydrofolate reductase